MLTFAYYAVFMKFGLSTQKKIEKAFEEADFKVRYERGNFGSGFCLLEFQNIIVVNKFLSVESQVQVLVDLMHLIEPKKDQLSPESSKLVESLTNKKTT
jgi:hypothetical protein